MHSPDIDSAFSKEGIKEIALPYCHVFFGIFLMLIGLCHIAESFAPVTYPLTPASPAIILTPSSSLPEISHIDSSSHEDSSDAIGDSSDEVSSVPDYSWVNVSDFRAEPSVPKAPTLDELNMCAQQPMIRNNIKCEGDPSCKKCFKTERSIGCLPFLPQFETEEMKNSVQGYVEETYGPPTSDKIITIMVSDKEFMPLVANWFESTKHISDVNLVLVALDEDAVARAKDFDFDAMPLFWEYHDCIKGNKAKIMQMIIMSYIAEAGYNVIMQDADVFWVKDPRPYLQALAHEETVDIMCQLAPRWDAQGQCNTGFLYISNRRIRLWFVKFFWQSLVFLTGIMDMINDDQKVFNCLLRHWRFAQVSQRILPLNYFLLAVDDVPKEAVTAHVVGSGEHGNGMVGKVDRIQRIDLWRLEYDPVKEWEENQAANQAKEPNKET